MERKNNDPLKEQSSNSSDSNLLKEVKALRLLLLIIVCAFACLFAKMLFVCDENDILQSRINLLEQRDSIYSSILNGDSVIPYRIKNGNVVTYSDLSDELVAKNQECDSLSKELHRYKMDLDLIYDNYNLRVIHKGNTSYTESAQLDSSMILLEAFRDRLHYDKESKSWTIKK